MHTVAFEGISDIKTGDISENEVEIYGTSEFPGNEVKIVGQALQHLYHYIQALFYYFLYLQIL